MLHVALLPLMILFASPNVSEPEQAFQDVVAHLRKLDLPAAWEGLAPDAQEKLGRSLREKLQAKPDAPMADVLAAWKKTMGGRDGAPLKQLASLAVKVHGTEKKGEDRVLLKASTKIAGFPSRGIIEMRKINGKWKIADVRGIGAANVAKATVKANQLGAVVTLRNLISAQAQMQAAGLVDCNNNGCGEYATFREMTGMVAVRGGKAKIDPPVLSSAFAKPKNGVVTRSGYHFRIYLPDAKGAAASEPGKIDPDKAEVLWCVYAWPVEAGKTGNFVFFTNQMGDVLIADAKDYSGAKGPSPYAAFAPDEEGQPVKSIAGPVAIKKKASDGQIWKPAG